MAAGPVFIVGCDRSGTTLLSLMITGSPSIHMTLESGFIPDLKRLSSEYSDFSEAKHKWYFIRDLKRFQSTSKTKAFDVFDLSEDEAYRALENVSPTNYVGAVDALFRADAEKNSKERWGNKTPEYILHIDWLSEAFPESQFIHIIRDPRDVSASICRAGWENNLADAAEYWKQRVEQGCQSGSLLKSKRYLEVRYEKLLLNPEDEISNLTEWLQIKPDPRMVRFYESSQDHIADAHQDLFQLLDRPIDRSRAFAWRREMRKKEIAEVENVTSSFMQQFGYKPCGEKVSLFDRGLRWSGSKIVSLGRRVKRASQPNGR